MKLRLIRIVLTVCTQYKLKSLLLVLLHLLLCFHLEFSWLEEVVPVLSSERDRGTQQRIAVREAEAKQKPSNTYSIGMADDKGKVEAISSREPCDFCYVEESVN